MPDERIQIDVADHVATATMVRADKHNALDRAMFEALHGAIDRLKAEPGVRAVVPVSYTHLTLPTTPYV